MSEPRKGPPTIDEYRALEAEVARLRRALKKYGRHTGECAAIGCLGTLTGRSCTCGLSAALAGENGGGT
jgi:hypothetical protein